MYQPKETRKKASALEAEERQMCDQRKRVKQLSQSLGDLPNFKTEIENKLIGKLPRPSPRSLKPRRLGETKFSPETIEMGTYEVTGYCGCALQPNVNGDVLSLPDEDAFRPPLSMDYRDQRLEEIARENADTPRLNFTRQKSLKVEDIVRSASKLEAEYLKRAKTPRPVHSRNCNQRSPFGNYGVCDVHCTSEKNKPSPRPAKRTLVVKIPRLSDTLSEHDYRGGWGPSNNFSYRHKR